MGKIQNTVAFSMVLDLKLFSSSVLSRVIESFLVYFAVINSSEGEKKWIFAFPKKVNTKVKATA